MRLLPVARVADEACASRAARAAFGLLAAFARARGRFSIGPGWTKLHSAAGYLAESPSAFGAFHAIQTSQAATTRPQTSLNKNAPELSPPMLCTT